MRSGLKPTFIKLSIVIPCFNEPETIETLVRLILQEPLPLDKEIIIVDDGSDIPLNRLISPGILRDPVIRLFRLRANCGKGSAIRFGLKKITGDVVLVHDADLEYHPFDIKVLLGPILDGTSRVVFGTRFHKVPRKMSLFHRLGNEWLTRMTNKLFHSKLTDMETGFKLLATDLITRLGLTSTEFEIEPEIAGKLLLKKVPIIEVPITYVYRMKGISKINVADGFDAFLVLIFIRFHKSPHHSKVYALFKRHVKRLLSNARDLIRGTSHKGVKSKDKV